jgi:GNAT superfamily N-acetyltransferase
MQTRPDFDIAPMTAADVQCIAELAAEVWRAHYPALITHAQIEYMLAQRYNREVMLDELRRTDLWWDVLRIDAAAAAFYYYFINGQAGENKNDKLYVRQQHQRRGLGGALIGRACAHARSLGCTRLILAVNKRNASAITAYQKHGFHIAESVVKDIGDGFIMDDYVMARAL